MSTGNLCSVDWLHWIECHPGLAGYIQAAGVIITVALALLGPPVVLLFRTARAWWLRRLDDIQYAHVARESIEAMITHIDARQLDLSKFLDARPAPDASLGFMWVPVSPYVTDMLGGNSNRRLLFLKQFGEQALAYNFSVAELCKNPSDDSERGSNILRASLVELRASALRVCGIIDKMKVWRWPWSRTVAR